MSRCLRQPPIIALILGMAGLAAVRYSARGAWPGFPAMRSYFTRSLGTPMSFSYPASWRRYQCRDLAPEDMIYPLGGRLVT